MYCKYENIEIDDVFCRDYNTYKTKCSKCDCINDCVVYVSSNRVLRIPSIILSKHDGKRVHFFGTHGEMIWTVCSTLCNYDGVISISVDNTEDAFDFRFTDIYTSYIRNDKIEDVTHNIIIV